MRRVCVFCGSNGGGRPGYVAAARTLGEALAQRGIGLVYGGSNIGLMGVLADAALAAGGEVIGVLPGRLVEREVAHRGLSQLLIVGSMHERKARMAELSDAFVVLPGGAGTLDELFETLTWGLLGLHEKPIALFDVDGYFASLLTFLDAAVREGFLRPEHRALLAVHTELPSLLDAVA